MNMTLASFYFILCGVPAHHHSAGYWFTMGPELMWSRCKSAATVSLGAALLTQILDSDW